MAAKVGAIGVVVLLLTGLLGGATQASAGPAAPVAPLGPAAPAVPGAPLVPTASGAPAAASVQVSLSSGHRLVVSVTPQRARGHRFVLHRLRAGEWKRVSAYRTRGGDGVRRLALLPGDYRVTVPNRGDPLARTATHRPPPAVTLQGRVRQLVNAIRQTPTRCGAERFGPARLLRHDSVLRATARRHARDMARAGRMTHNSPAISRHYPRGAGPSVRAGIDGYPTRYVGENVAVGYPDAAAVVRAWRRSPGHCVNLMRPGYEQIGLGYAHGYWTLLLGSRRL